MYSTLKNWYLVLSKYLETKMFILHLLDHFDCKYLIPEELYWQFGEMRHIFVLLLVLLDIPSNYHKLFCYKPNWHYKSKRFSYLDCYVIDCFTLFCTLWHLIKWNSPKSLSRCKYENKRFKMRETIFVYIPTIVYLPCLNIILKWWQRNIHKIKHRETALAQ